MSWPRFDAPVANGGYRWWYIDGLSDDGLHGITIIAFVGSVFSPYYARARRRSLEHADPRDHCALNVALYGRAARPGRSWSMTERGRSALRRSETILSIGPSQISREGDSLIVRIDEMTAPLPSRLRGSVRLTPKWLTDLSVPLDVDGHHLWLPSAPCSNIEVSLDSPLLAWRGRGYFDSNTGETPVEDAFRCWHWSRGILQDRDTAVTYDLVRSDGSLRSIALRFDDAGNAMPFVAPPAQRLRASGWRIARQTRADAGHAPRIAATFEDGPFYSRSLVHSTMLGQPMTSVHESLDLIRFRSRWVQALLPFRMPRRA